MRNKFLSIITLILFTTVLISSCRRRSGPLSCAASTVDYSQELSQFLGNQTKANCERVVKSIEDVYKSCTTPGSFDRDELEQAEADLDCDSL